VLVGPPSEVIRRLRPHVVVVDDPIAADARRWIAGARRAGCRVVTVHDLGLGARDGDLVVDGSVVRAAAARLGRALRGPRFASLDPRLPSMPPVSAAGRDQRVLISLGGGPRAALAWAIARAIHTASPQTRIRIAGGFAALPAHGAGAIAWTGPLDGLAGELVSCDVAVVGGGVSLYEACALGVASVAVPVVAPQRPTVRGFVAKGAARGGEAVSPDRIAAVALDLLSQPAERARVAARGRRVIDGRGASRVAAEVRRLVGACSETAHHA
jgi:spore coat polysaccharide biosynthesis predicted glycosyltransferase SpsG